VLDDVERRRFLVKPAREGAFPALVRLLHVELDERAGQLLVLPRCGCFARAQAHDHVLPAHRLSRVKRDILDDAVALVENAENRDPLRHRRHATFAIGGRGDLPRRGRRRVPLLGAFAARRERKRSDQRSSQGAHVYSGSQGS
jgi:hypothetical protein